MGPACRNRICFEEVTLSTPLHPLQALVIGKAASPIAARQYANHCERCPYTASHTVKGYLVKGVYVIPETLTWWLELLQKYPKQVGMENIAVFISEELEAASPWSRGQTTPALGQSPCGAQCSACPEYRDRCSGCPSTRDYHPE